MQTLPYVLDTVLGALVGAVMPWCTIRLLDRPALSDTRGEWMYWLCSLTGGALAWVCATAATPELGRAALVYGGLGAVLGQGILLHGRGGRAVCGLVCAWVVACLPFTGALACLGAMALALAAECPQLGLAAVPVFAAPVALLQFGAFDALVAAQQMIEKGFSVTKDHGKFYDKQGTLFMATLHPAALLRNPNNKPLAFGDFAALREKILEVCEHTY